MSVKNLATKPYFWGSLGLLFAVVAGVLWCYRLSNNPERAFWGMINQSLATSGVTINATQNNNGTTARESVQYSFGAPNISRTLTHLSQTGTTVTNESVGVPTGDYTRYTSIATVQKSASGKKLNFTSVLGVWATGGNDPSARLLPQAALGTGLPLGGLAVPIGNLNPALRTKFVQQLHGDNLYQISFDKVKKATVKGRLQYGYDVTMQPVAYANMMKRFAKNVGLHTFDSIDPAAFANQPAFSIHLTVDVRSHHLVQAQTTGATVTQTYTAYDVPVGIIVPSKTVPLTELQKRLTTLQQ